MTLGGPHPAVGRQDDGYRLNRCQLLFGNGLCFPALDDGGAPTVAVGFGIRPKFFFNQGFEPGR